MQPGHCDVVVVGAGNAAMCAALVAREQGATVVVLERAPEVESGGNTHFTAGANRFASDGLEDLRSLMPDLAEEEIARTDFVPLHRRPVLRRHGARRSTARIPISPSFSCAEASRH